MATTNPGVPASPVALDVIDQILPHTTRIRYLTEAIEEASDHVRSPRGEELDAMNKMLVFTAMVRDASAEVARIIVAGRA